MTQKLCKVSSNERWPAFLSDPERGSTRFFFAPGTKRSKIDSDGGAFLTEVRGSTRFIKLIHFNAKNEHTPKTDSCPYNFVFFPQPRSLQALA